MTISSGSGVVRNGLVFHYDMENSAKSWKGRPGHNYIPNGHFANGAGVTSESGSNATNEIIYFPDNPGHSDWVLAQSGASTSEYEIHLKSGYTIQPNTTYCLSAWVSKSVDYNGNYNIFHSRYYNTDGTNWSSNGQGTVYETKIVEGREWQRRYYSFTTGALASGAYYWFFGYGNGVTTGYMYATDIQMEEGSFPSPYIDDERTTTQALIDLTGNNTITASSLTYNSDGTFEFDGSTNYATVGNLGSFGEITVEVWVNYDAIDYYRNPVDCNYTTGGSGTGNIGPRMEVNSSGNVSWVWSANTTTNNTYSGLISAYGISTGNWYHSVFSWKNSSTYAAYINGVNNGYTASHNGSNNGAWTGAVSDLFIGKGFTLGPANQRSMDGKIGSVKIYNRALSAEEVLQNYEASRGRYGV